MYVYACVREREIERERGERHTLERRGDRSVTLMFFFMCASYGVATISRLLKIVGLFCRISSFL